jgi:DNA-binding NarL/FixJ family response regulator
VRVVIGSDQSLVAESVAAALRTRSFDALVVRGPADGADVGRKPRRLRPPRGSVGPPPDVGLVLSDLARGEQVRGAQTLASGLRVPWLVMAGVPPGPAWGGLYEQGASLVVPSDTGLDAVSALLTDLAAGRQPTGPRRQRRALIQQWRAFAERRGEMSARLRTLTQREEEVLQQLYLGMAVRAIAEDSEVTESTVRGQVKAILRKLEVNSQLAAVAAYGNVLTDTVEAGTTEADPIEANPNEVG